MIIDEEEYLAHYGTLHRSGRYPWGSGDNPRSTSRSFLDEINEMRRNGMPDTEIAKAFDTSTTRLRRLRTIANNEKKQADISQAMRLQADGHSNIGIGTIMGRNESSVRALLASGAQEKATILDNTAKVLKAAIAEKKYIDIGTGEHYQMNIPANTLATAVTKLRGEGYTLHYIKVPQLGTVNKETTVMVLAAPGTTYSEVFNHRGEISQVNKYTQDSGRSFLGLHPPIAINPDRVAVRYADEGGAQTDGVIFVRRGVKDVSLGSKNYAQVRVQVGDGHYLKGMAMYKNDLPDGVDLMFNTAKKDTGNKLDAMKPLESNIDNPFKAVVRQIVKRDSDGKEFLTSSSNRGFLDGTEKVTSAMNIVYEEGDWKPWSKTLSSQMLSKQSPTLAKAQLDKTYEHRLKEYDELSKLTNPTVKKQLLEKFGDATDASAVHLEAAALSTRQGWHAILPIDSMPPNQIYAPGYRDGERVVLIRYPHAGRFEIPELTVNNRHPEARSLLGDAQDAVGIHQSVAQHLSGADFDGDTVLVIPNNSGKVKTTPQLKELQNFDPQLMYPEYDGMKRMTIHQKGMEMGKISNLITDMTIRQAPVSELTRAVKHSMVVIDAEKHHLNYKQSAIDNGIKNLKLKYQGGERAGANTLISLATAEQRVVDRKPRLANEGGAIDRETGKRAFVDTGKLNYKTGKPSTIKSKKLAETDDAFTLVSEVTGTPMERVYAEHSNRLKALANQARKESINTPRLKYDGSARKTYSNEVQSLSSKLHLALMNSPLERQAQTVGNAIVRAQLNDNPGMDNEMKKRLYGQALNEARTRVGARKEKIHITDKEWEAVQAGAISDHRLSLILKNADLDRVRELATPRVAIAMSPTRTARAKQMLANGATRAEVADQLGVSLSTLDLATGPTEEKG